jgi:hypothetical protein
LIINIDSVEDVMGSAYSGRGWTTETGNLLTRTSRRAEIDHIRQTVPSHLHYEHWRDSRLQSAELGLFHLLWRGIEEIVLTLREAGFVDMVVSGNHRYRRQPRKGAASWVLRRGVLLADLSGFCAQKACAGGG